ncbi:(1-_4)-alpha-D-glucan 1-alpha-D-glucosylmutase [Granulicella aggregans]|uniref:(1->4)-alpha-D-glucan 1-alpha-D-glucosylmutase n=1 Tax=Granulicella aggregans TaxID=474949 RepID=A0A7W8E2Q5_9BACT|nr:malto-oligosyltrehalose synthase [Granulicella aggregans]MBB5056626.1 (1->4)-alpha-D-glucan 1-alpha-D-glucosylmutase [Granulicella aggregans]
MPRTPQSTYRLQLHKDFTFDDAAAIANYLRELGVSHVYSSPYLQAAPGSTHGYDVVDHRRVNEELGGVAAHKRFCEKLGETRLGQVLDIVPNHMSLGRENHYWWDVLENGPSSRYASFFDIDWQPQEERLRDKVLVPVLADQYGRVLQAGGIEVKRSGNRFLVCASEQQFPTSPLSLTAILPRAAEYAKSDTLSFLAASYGRLPVPEYWDRRLILTRHRDKTVLNKMLGRLCAEEPAACEAIDRAVAELNANQDALDDFLSQQNYRLSYWKTADQQLGYRRFFDVNTLIGLRIEREHVFEETHELILGWLKEGVLDGIRIDHPDGLRDPLEYFRRLRAAAPEAWIVGEKILEPGEFLRQEWPIEGTSGYDFLNVALNILVKPEGVAELDRIYAEFTDRSTDFHAIAHDKKLAVTQEALGSDVNRLTSIFVNICETNRNQRDYTRAEIRRAIREVASCFTVYRTYVVPSRNEITSEDREVITAATECAKANRSDIDGGLFDFLRDVLTMQVTGKEESEFVLRFQQFTGPVMAKGVEDTAFYCYNRLTAMNEVGADPSRQGSTIEEFHAYNAKMQATHPLTMTTLSTHDTKRSEDVRARMAVLSEIPEVFAHAIYRWSENTTQHRASFLDKGTQYFYYQTLIAAWPITPDRMKAYMQKAMREAKEQTTWVANNKDYEDAVNNFIDGTFSDKAFLAEVETFVVGIKRAGWMNSLSQTLLKLTGPGVPDQYQGTELWDLSLVDPDNRRPVDYDLRRRLLKEVHVASLEQIMQRIDEGLPKLWTIHRGLTLRRRHPERFGETAAYTPIIATGRKAEHAVAFLRGDSVATIVPRWTMSLNNDWADTKIVIPEGRWHNHLTDEPLLGGTHLLSQLLAEFPVALLTKEEE